MVVTREGGGRRIRRLLLIAAPFPLIALGGWSLFRSPWPAILRLTLQGQHLYAVRPNWGTVGLPLVTLACWSVAIWLSLRVKTNRG